MVFGCWLLAVGLWLLAVGLWLLAVGLWLLAKSKKQKAISQKLKAKSQKLKAKSQKLKAKKKKEKLKKITYILILFCANLTAQTLYNNGSSLNVKEGGVLFVNGDFQNNTGNTQNEGEVTVAGSIINNDDISGVGLDSKYELTGDWINNGIFTAGQGIVLMNGNNELIAGSQSSTFYNLVLDGGGIKTQTINAFVENQLNLNAIELATETYNLYLQNPDINALQLTSGFVSSLENGAFYRETNAEADYLFPTGSSINSPRYRPVEIRPETTNLQEYGVRFVNNDPDFEGYDRESIQSDTLCTINPAFYHHLYHTKGTDAADIALYFDESEDMSWSRIGHWKGGAWLSTGPSYIGSNFGLTSLSFLSWTDFDSRAFALASERPYLNAGENQEIKLGQITFLDAEFDGQNGGSPVWDETAFLECLTCLDTKATPVKTTTFGIELTDNFGCTVRDEVTVFVNGVLILMPTGFTPNGDNVNDVFRPFNEIFDDYHLAVYNRWGQKLFDSYDPDTGWDGTFNGKQQDTGVYIYDLEYSFIGEGRTRFYQGNVTLVR